MENKQKNRFGDTPNKRIKSYFHAVRYNNLIEKINSCKFGKSKHKGIIELEPNFSMVVCL